MEIKRLVKTYYIGNYDSSYEFRFFSRFEDDVNIIKCVCCTTDDNCVVLESVLNTNNVDINENRFTIEAKSLEGIKRIKDIVLREVHNLKARAKWVLNS